MIDGVWLLREGRVWATPSFLKGMITKERAVGEEKTEENDSSIQGMLSVRICETSKWRSPEKV